MNYVAVEDVGSHRERVTEAIAWTTYIRTPSTASSVQVRIDLMPISDFIDENSFSTMSLNRDMDPREARSKYRSDTRWKKSLYQWCPSRGGG